jgi:hypothetical protein
VEFQIFLSIAFINQVSNTGSLEPLYSEIAMLKKIKCSRSWVKNPGRRAISPKHLNPYVLINVALNMSS